MGQAANSGRRAELDQKKRRAAGRKQNDPSVEAITDRQEKNPVPGAFGRKDPLKPPPRTKRKRAT